ncbi:hypothetical protein H2O64_08925 [Kordia sp. YSTF-M3]|uniref:DUF4252 domain-containing protein n=1 Tax=Kordia aestuariivivens TaxID=2759037 RepID=A0ABR7Q8V5_9FLAO|nr:hypothetical protein [Kordia aestuariivivens]MBC8754791.1 hypothetical protein [Kordia aestuariivivens]
MKKIVVLLLLFVGIQQSVAQKKIYVSDKFEELSKDHKTIAILPFQTTLNLKSEQTTYTEAQIKELAEKEGIAVQQALESYFLNRKKKKKLKIEFQDIDTTNRILKKAGITLENIDIYTPQELSKILNVDAIISGSLTSRLLLSKEVDTSFDFISFLKGKSDYGKIIIKLSDKNTGKLLWRYEKTINRKSGKNTKNIIAIMMRQASRKFPYEEKR